MKLQDLKKYKLLDNPGVYFFKKGNEILYIGKATSLKDRVRSYFSNDLIKTRGSRMVDMITISNNLEFVKTNNVLEALVIEANKIKENEPKYNTMLKDDKSFNFLVVTDEEIPKVYIERGRTLEFVNNKKFKKVFGPYISGTQLKEGLKIIRKIFPFLTNKNNSNLYKQIGLEPDLKDKASIELYKNNIKNIVFFFQGRFKEIEKGLVREMKAYSKKQEFEKAGEVKKQLFALKHIRDVALIKDDEIDVFEKYRIEAYDIAHLQGSNSIGVMTVMENGKVKKSDYRKFILRKTKKGDDVGGLREVLERRFGHTEWKFPDLVVIDGGKGQYSMAKKLLKKIGIGNVVSVVKDEKHKPKDFIGNKTIIEKYKKDILLINNEAHRFAITFYRSKHRKALLNK